MNPGQLDFRTEREYATDCSNIAFQNVFCIFSINYRVGNSLNDLQSDKSDTLTPLFFKDDESDSLTSFFLKSNKSESLTVAL